MTPEDLLYPWKKDPEIQRLIQNMGAVIQKQNDIINLFYTLAQDLRNHPEPAVYNIGARFLDQLNRYGI